MSGDREEMHAMIRENGGHPVLMDALCSTLLRYMAEHPAPDAQRSAQVGRLVQRNDRRDGQG